jgi:hypothetical protein
VQWRIFPGPERGHCEPCQASGSDVVTQDWLFLILGALAVGISVLLSALSANLIKNQSFFLGLFDRLSSNSNWLPLSSLLR